MATATSDATSGLPSLDHRQRCSAQTGPAGPEESLARSMALSLSSASIAVRPSSTGQLPDSTCAGSARKPLTNRWQVR